MVEKEIEIEDKKFKIKELPYLEIISTEEGNRKEWFKNMLKKSIVEPEPTDEMIEQLTFKEGNGLMKEINKLNGITSEIEDFPKPSNTDEKK